MANPTQIIDFLRDCHEADNREASIANLFDRKVRRLAFLEGEEDLLQQRFDERPFEDTAAEEIDKEALLTRISHHPY